MRCLAKGARGAHSFDGVLKWENRGPGRVVRGVGVRLVTGCAPLFRERSVPDHHGSARFPCTNARRLAVWAMAAIWQSAIRDTQSHGIGRNGGRIRWGGM